MPMNLAPVLRQRFFDSNGDPLAGGLVYTYQAGTTTPQNTYTNSGGLTPNANPVVLDANGEAAIWFDPSLSYKVTLKNSAGVTQWTEDNIVGLLGASSVGTSAIIDGAVTTAKVADDAITADKLKDSVGTDGDRAVTTNHIRDAAITRAKMATGAVAKRTVQSKTASFTASTDDDVYLCDATGGAITVTLPASASSSGKTWVVEKTDSSTNAVTIDGNGAETVGDATTTALYTQRECVSLLADGTNVQIIERRISGIWTSYTPTFTNLPATSSIQFFWRRVGDSIDINGRVVFGAGGAAAEARISLPSGVTVDSTNVPQSRLFGIVALETNFSTPLWPVASGGNTYFAIAYATTGPQAGGNGNNFANFNMQIYLRGLPVSGWGY